MPKPPTVEAVTDGEKGIARLRTDKRIKRWLSAKRPKPELGPESRVISYRTEACLAVHMAHEAGADEDTREFLLSEYKWAVSSLEETHPYIDWRLTLKRREQNTTSQMTFDF